MEACFVLHIPYTIDFLSSGAFFSFVLCIIPKESETRRMLDLNADRCRPINVNEKVYDSGCGEAAGECHDMKCTVQVKDFL